MDIKEIRKLLPHRYPFLLIDRVVDKASTPDNSIIALKNVTMNEPFFNGHFPDNPVMPGVLVVEALAQAAAILTCKVLGKSEINHDEIFYLAGIDNVRFKQIVQPGDQLILTVEVERQKGNIWKYKGIAKVDDKIACTADIIGHFETGDIKKKQS